MKAIKIKNWCLENITPQSWSRIVLRTLPQLREHNLDLNEIENPGDDLELNEEVMQILETAMEDLYQLKIDNEVMG